MYDEHINELKHVLVEQFAKGAAPGPGFKAILKAVQEPYRSSLRDYLDGADHAADARRLKSWLREVLDEEPPPDLLVTLVTHTSDDFIYLTGEPALPESSQWKPRGEGKHYRQDLEEDVDVLRAMFDWHLGDDSPRKRRTRSSKKKGRSQPEEAKPDLDDAMVLSLDLFLTLAYGVLATARLARDFARKLSLPAGERAILASDDPPIEVGRIKNGIWKPATVASLKSDLGIGRPRKPPKGQEPVSDIIDRIVLSGPGLKEGLEMLRRRLAKRMPSYVWDIIPKLKYAEDERRCKSWFGKLIEAGGLRRDPAVLVFCVVLPAERKAPKTVCDVALGTGSIGDEKSCLAGEEFWEYVAYNPYRADSRVINDIFLFGTEDERASQVPEGHEDPQEVAETIVLTYAGILACRLCKHHAAKLKTRVKHPCYVRWGYAEGNELVGAITKSGWKQRSPRTKAVNFKP